MPAAPSRRGTGEPGGRPGGGPVRAGPSALAGSGPARPPGQAARRKGSSSPERAGHRAPDTSVGGRTTVPLTRRSRDGGLSAKTRPGADRFRSSGAGRPPAGSVVPLAVAAAADQTCVCGSVVMWNTPRPAGSIVGAMVTEPPPSCGKAYGDPGRKTRFAPYAARLGAAQPTPVPHRAAFPLSLLSEASEGRHFP
nr:hypothetical protein StreXyl84_06750 [Streptomyces sp. Xyl84]